MEAFGNEIKDLRLGECALVRLGDCQNGKLVFGKRLEVISLYGEVAGCEKLGKISKDPNKQDKLVFYLDDGKNIVKCMTSLQPNNPQLLADVTANWTALNSIPDKDKDDMAAFQLATVTKNLLIKNNANVEKIKPGIFVQVWGKIRTYRDENYIYVTNMRVISNTEDKIYSQKSFEVVSTALDQFERFLKEEKK